MGWRATSTVDLPDYLERVSGALLGAACGDVLGAAVEGLDSHIVTDRYPKGLTSFQPTKRGYGCYTDDTQMTIALTRSLVRKRRCDAADASSAYAREFQPHRGYSSTTSRILEHLQRGGTQRTLARRTSVSTQSPGGSFANGGAMRISPLGLAYRYASPKQLLVAVQDALRCTHTHPVGIDGAFIQAAAVAALCTMPSPHRAAAASTTAAASHTADAAAGASLPEAATATASAAAVATTNAAAAASATGSSTAAAAAGSSIGHKRDRSGASVPSHEAAAGLPTRSGVADRAAEFHDAGPSAAGSFGAPLVCTPDDAGRAAGGECGGGGGAARAAVKHDAAPPAPAQPGWRQQQQLVVYLAGIACTEEMRQKLQKLEWAVTQVDPKHLKAASTPWSEHLLSRGWAKELAVVATLAAVFQIRATDAVAVALCAVCFHWEYPEDAVVAAVHYGGDTDTIASMAGALAGALHGIAWLPPRWLNHLENGPAGRDEIYRLATQLAALRCDL